jgi:DNA-binding response OmpR family regulator
MSISAARTETPSYAPPAGDDLVVLIVSADANLRAAAARVAAREGYQALTAAHAGHALLASLRVRIDLLAADLSMEEMSGPALAEKLRRHHPQLGTVYFGSAGTRECDGVLVRPFTGDDLLRALLSARAEVLCRPTFSVV